MTSNPTLVGGVPVARGMEASGQKDEGVRDLAIERSTPWCQTSSSLHRPDCSQTDHFGEGHGERAHNEHFDADVPQAGKSPSQK
jgi:hypothetical protein